MANGAVHTAIQGVRVPRLIYGTAWKKDRTANLVEQALTTGFRGLDTACQPKHYDEAGVGEGLAAWSRKGFRREDIYLQSKFTPSGGQDPERTPYDRQAPLATQVAQSFAVSQRNLQTDYLDALILHSPLPDDRELEAVWRAMEAIHTAGGTKLLGISNCYALPRLEYLYRFASVKPTVLQNRFYAETGFDWPLRQFCRTHGILYQSFWTLTANRDFLASTALQELASRLNRSAEQVFFRFLTQIGIAPLTGTTSLAHMREDLEIFEFELSSSECQALDAMLLERGQQGRNELV